MTAILTTTLPMNSRVRSRAVPTQKQSAKFPTAMLLVAGFFDGIQVIAGWLLLGLVAIPWIGIIFVVLGYLVNILVTVVLLMFFGFWLHHIGLRKSVILWFLLVILAEVFSSGIAPLWTLLVLRAKHEYKKQNKKGAGVLAV